jgi:hypothetical protein
MSVYRIFTRDRGTKYSALMEIRSNTEENAVKKAKTPASWGAVAIAWPPTEKGKEWLKKNV